MACTLTPVGRLDLAAHPGGDLAPSDLLSTVREALRDRYAVAGEIGRGGMAVVCRATDLRHGREVAIKVLLPELARAVTGDRFLREIGILARLSHPGILPLLDSGAVEVVPGLEVPWYVMPYVAEDTLRARLEREGPLPVDQALQFARELCGALAHAHRQGIIHRDIKPENILLSGGRAVLADFGIARAVTLSGTSSLSSTGLVIGTPAYMSPEQSAGSEKLDARSDLYSLGVVLYEMLAGQPPFTGATPQAISARHQFETPPPIRVVRPTIPVGVEAVLSRVLEKVPADRYEGAEALARALEGANTGALPVDRITLTGLRVHRRRRLQVLARAVLGVLVSAAVVAGGWAWYRQRNIDPDTLLVLPFVQQGDAPLKVLSGDGCASMVYDALARWGKLKQVDPLRVQDAIARLGAPATLSQAEVLARWLGAGRLIWGQVLQVGDSTRVHGRLYRIGGFGSTTIVSRVQTLPGPALLEAGGRPAMAEVVRGFLTLARRLAAPADPDSLGGDEVLATDSYDALRAYISGDSALRAWDLDQARAGFQRAIAFDPTYPQANLALAQLGQWEGDSAGAWRPFIDAAQRGVGRLTHRQVALADALVAFAASRYPEACTAYRSMIARDSADFVAWFGLGECLAGDRAVIPDKHSPSGYAFRSSYEQALRAYDRALTLLPLVHAAYAGAAMTRLLDRYYVETNRFRDGALESDTRVHFASFPGRDADTISFIPRPIDEILNGQWGEDRDLRSNALARQRLLRVTGDWVRAFSAAATAWRAHGIALEVSGLLVEGVNVTTSALGAYRRSRELTAGSHERLELGIAQLRVLVKSRRFSEAAILADSLLSQSSPATATEAFWLAGVAALVGRPLLAADLVRAASDEAEFVTSTGQLVRPGGALAREALRLLVFSSFQSFPESVASIAARVSGAIAKMPSALEPQRYLGALMDRPRLLAYPVLGAPTGSGILRGIEQALSAGDDVAAVDGLARLKRFRSGLRSGDATMDISYLEVRLALCVGDTAGALRRARESLAGLPISGLDLIADVPQAGAVSGILQLSSEIASRLGDSALATSLQSEWRALLK